MDELQVRSHLFYNHKHVPPGFHPCDSLDNKYVSICHGTYNYDALLYKVDRAHETPQGYIIEQEEKKVHFCKVPDSGKFYQRTMEGLDLFLPNYYRNLVLCGEELPKLYNHNMIKMQGVSQPKSRLTKEQIKEEDPETYTLLEELIDNSKIPLDPLKNVIQDLAASNGISLGDIFYRHKSIESAYDKIKRQKNVTVENIHDINGIKATPEKIEDCYKLLELIDKNLCPIGKFFDYITVPKPNGFQCIMARPLDQSLRLDIHIQTPKMKKHAEEGPAAEYHQTKEILSQDALSLQI
ncbi:MAG: hypothetical protein ACQESG_08085 [Nanobdellota archaeon]